MTFSIVTTVLATLQHRRLPIALAMKIATVRMWSKMKSFAMIVKLTFLIQLFDCLLLCDCCCVVVVVSPLLFVVVLCLLRRRRRRRIVAFHEASSLIKAWSIMARDDSRLNYCVMKRGTMWVAETREIRLQKGRTMAIDDQCGNDDAKLCDISEAVCYRVFQ